MSTPTAEQIGQALRPIKFPRCDYIADIIKTALRNDPDDLLLHIGRVQLDLHPTGGYLVSTKKTIEVRDTNDRKYRITVEEMP